MITFAAVLLAAAGLANAETTYFGAYLGDVKIGSMTRETATVTFEGRPALRTHTRWDTCVEIGGFKQRSVTDNVTWTTPDGRPLRQVATVDNNGKRTREESTFGPATVAVDTEDGGKRTHATGKLPKGPVFLDLSGDLPRILHRELKGGGTVGVWSYGSAEFGLVMFESRPSTSVQVDGKTVAAAVAEFKPSGGLTVRILTDSKGALLRLEFPNAFVVRAEPKAVALARPTDEELKKADLLAAQSMKIDGDTGDSMTLSHLKLRLVGVDLSGAPSDDGQTITRDGDGWIVDVHPRPLGQDGPEIPLRDLAKGQETWTKPSPNLSSDDPKLKALAQKLVEGRPQLDGALQGVWLYMDEHMKYEIGLGPTRDAKDVLRDPKGKCTDYAILTVALLRAAGVPARIAEGLVDIDNALYYHAWCEVWDGRKWVGFDSAAPYGPFAAAYLKLNQGNVADTLDKPGIGEPKKAKITLLDAVHRS